MNWFATLLKKLKATFVSKGASLFFGQKPTSDKGDGIKGAAVGGVRISICKDKKVISSQIMTGSEFKKKGTNELLKALGAIAPQGLFSR